MGLVPIDVETEGLNEEDLLLGGDQESRFFTCHVCGDNWLTVKLTQSGGETRLTFVHQMGMEPTLKRVATMATPLILSEETVESWDYFMGEDPVAEGEWRAVLDRRRFVLRSICSN
jgi:hypothetical protein